MRAFRKEVLRPGTYYIPRANGNFFVYTATPDDVRSMYATGKAMRQAGISIPLPLEHQDDAVPLTASERKARSVMFNGGWVNDFTLEKDGSLWMEAEVDPSEHVARRFGLTLDELADKLETTIRYVSPEIRSMWQTGDGNTWKNCITHIALTTKPIWSTQRAFGQTSMTLPVAQPLAVALSLRDDFAVQLSIKDIDSVEQIGHVTVRTVESMDIRNESLEKQEFGDVGTHQTFDFIPENEIWIAHRITAKERPFLIANGLAQLKGKNQEEAAELGLEAEEHEREKVTGIKKSNKTGQKIPAAVYASEYGKVTQDGHEYTVWNVVLGKVRDYFETEFVEGGNHEALPFIPEYEYWLEEGLHDEEKPFILLHEMTECPLMKQGESYEKAHAHASKVEWQARQGHGRWLCDCGNIIKQCRCPADAKHPDLHMPAGCVNCQKEARKDKHKYSCVYGCLPANLSEILASFSARIPDTDLDVKGREDVGNAHVTALYGICTSDVRKVEKAIKDFGPITLAFGMASLFDGHETHEEYDVLKVDVISQDLCALNALLQKKLAHVNTHPDYKPHVTIAYLKPGCGQQYCGPVNFLTNQRCTITEVVFSPKTGEKSTIELGDEPANGLSDRDIGDYDDAQSYVDELNSVKSEPSPETMDGMRNELDGKAFQPWRHPEYQTWHAVPMTSLLDNPSAFMTGIQLGRPHHEWEPAGVSRNGTPKWRNPTTNRIIYQFHDPNQGVGTAESIAQSRTQALQTPQIMERQAGSRHAQNRAQSLLNLHAATGQSLENVPQGGSHLESLKAHIGGDKGKLHEFLKHASALTRDQLKEISHRLDLPLREMAKKGAFDPESGEGMGILGALHQHLTGGKLPSGTVKSSALPADAETPDLETAPDKSPIAQPKEPISEETIKANPHYKAIVDETTNWAARDGGDAVPNHPDTAIIPTKSIFTDEDTFQYKLGMGKGGAGSKLKDVEEYQKLFGDVALVWHDEAKGKTFVVNGHHRKERADALGQPEMLVMYLNPVAKTAEEARAWGALKNMNEDSGTAIDAAKFLRDNNGLFTDERLRKLGISMKGKTIQAGKSLANLSPGLFRHVVSGVIPEDVGVAIGEMLPNEADQMTVYQRLDAAQQKGKQVSADTVREMAQMAVDAPRVQGSEQPDLFGNMPEAKSIFVEIAEARAAIKQKIMEEARMFGAVADPKKKTRLEAEGKNVIDVQANKAKATEARQHANIFDNGVKYRGPLSELVNQAAERIANGEDTGKVVNEFYPTIRDAIKHHQLHGPSVDWHRPVGGYSGEVEKPASANPVVEAKRQEPKHYGEAAEQLLADALSHHQATGKSPEDALKYAVSKMPKAAQDMISAQLVAEKHTGKELLAHMASQLVSAAKQSATPAAQATTAPTVEPIKAETAPSTPPVAAPAGTPVAAPASAPAETPIAPAPVSVSSEKQSWRSRTEPALLPSPNAPEVDAVTPVQVKMLADIIRNEPHQFGRMVAVRDAMVKAGVVDPAQQDAIIRRAQRDGVVSAAAYEGRHGITQEEQVAGMTEKGGRQGENLGTLLLRPPKELAQTDFKASEDAPAAKQSWRTRKAPGTAPLPGSLEVTTVTPDQVKVVTDFVGKSESNFAPLSGVRDALEKAGIDDPVQQDAVIQRARKDGLVSAGNFEGRHGSTAEDQASGLREEHMDVGDFLGHLVLKQPKSFVTSGPGPEKPGVTPAPSEGDAGESTRSLHDSMSGGSKPLGGSEAMFAKIQKHMDFLASLPKSEVAKAWHEGLGGAQKFPSKDAYLDAIRKRITGRAGAYDRAGIGAVPEKQATDAKAQLALAGEDEEKKGSEGNNESRKSEKANRHQPAAVQYAQAEMQEGAKALLAQHGIVDFREMVSGWAKMGAEIPDEFLAVVRDKAKEGYMRKLVRAINSHKAKRGKTQLSLEKVLSVSGHSSPISGNLATVRADGSPSGITSFSMPSLFDDAPAGGDPAANPLSATPAIPSPKPADNDDDADDKTGNVSDFLKELEKHGVIVQQTPGMTCDDAVSHATIALRALSGVLQPKEGGGPTTDTGVQKEEPSSVAMSQTNQTPVVATPELVTLQLSHDTLKSSNDKLRSRVAEMEAATLVSRIDRLAAANQITPARAKQFKETLAVNDVRMSLADESQHIKVAQIKAVLDYAEENAPKDLQLTTPMTVPSADAVALSTPADQQGFHVVPKPAWDSGEPNAKRMEEVEAEYFANIGLKV